MCLNTITKRIDEPSKTIVKAWGIFNIFGGCEDGPINQVQIEPHCRYNGNPIKFGKWEKADNVRDYSNGGNTYLCGFHKYTNKRAAERLRDYHNLVIPVQLRKVRTVGEEAGKRVLVADEMKVLKKDAMKAFKEWKRRNK